VNLSCPQCGEPDQVQSVPAVFQSGHLAYHTDHQVVAFVNGIALPGVTREEHVAVTHTASALDPKPPLRRGGGCFLALALFLLPPTILFSFIAVQVYSDEGGRATTAGHQVASFIGSWLIPGFTAALVTIFFALFIRRQRINARLCRGNPASVALWSAAWFCHRCGGVFFPVGTPLDIPAGQLLPPLAFRQLVWTAAGL
jgi:hypothetical protein